MPLQMVQGDITKIKCDAVVNAANETLLGGGGVDGAIHKAAGKELLEECRTLHGCKTGQAKITKGYRLPCRYVIHTVGPIWQGGGYGEQELLTACYRESLRLAVEYDCQSVAFPLISAGVYRYPKAEALHVAMQTITDFLMDVDLDVTLVIYDKEVFRIDPVVETELLDSFLDAIQLRNVRSMMDAEMACADGLPDELENVVNHPDESFSQMLLRKIDEQGMTDAECYKKANVDRKLFSKIRSNVNYKPSKATAVAFGIALELPMEELDDFLRKAGYALSPSNKFDLIIAYFVQRGNYQIYEINAVLFQFDQCLLGA